jgi:hypothetical protein
MADIDTTAIAPVAEAAQVAARAAPPAPPPPPLMHKSATVMSNWAARAAGTGFATAALLPWRVDPQSWPHMWLELWQMQQAVWRRQSQLQNNWVQDWADWANGFTQARGANTMAKLVEQEFDLVVQWHELVSGQATDVVRLLENLEVNYAFWVDEKLRSGGNRSID